MPSDDTFNPGTPNFKDPQTSGLGQTFSRTPGTVGYCDEIKLEFKDSFRDQEKIEAQVKDRLAQAGRALSAVIRYIREYPDSESCKAYLRSYFNVPRADDAVLNATRDRVVEVLTETEKHFKQCRGVEFVIAPTSSQDIRNVGGETPTASVEKAWRISSSAPFIGRVTVLTLYLPGFISLGKTDTIIHEFVHLAGPGGDVYFNDAEYHSLSNEQLLEQADAYAQFVVQLAAAVERKSEQASGVAP